MSTLVVPFEIGQKFWKPITSGEKKRVECPVCFGKLAIIIELGNGERIGVPCDGCGHGYDGPRGWIGEWDYTPGAKPFTIARVKSMHDGNWSLESAEGGWAYLSDLYPTEAEALERSRELCAQNHESNMRSRQHGKDKMQRAGWSIRYHRECIRDLERQIAWHNSRIIKQTK
jgi:hypothetical protein